MKPIERWPVHPPPLPDELLSSWLVRLARANHQKLHVFTRLLYPAKPVKWLHNGKTQIIRSSVVWFRDVDRSAKDDLLERLAHRSGQTLGRVTGTTLRGFERALSSRISPGNGVPRWLGPLGVRGTKHKGYGLQCCPICLAEDSIPYYRRIWRLAFITICPVHWTPLIDRCPKCGAMIAFHQLEYDASRPFPTEDPITLCHACRFDLRDAKPGWDGETKAPVRARISGHNRQNGGVRPVRSRSSIGATRLFYFQAWLLEGLERGWFDVADLRTTRLSGRIAHRNWVRKGRLKDLSGIRRHPTERVSSGEFFDGMRQVVKLLASDCGPNWSRPWSKQGFAFKPRNREVANLCHDVRCRVGVRKLPSGEARASDSFERMLIEERRIVMMMAAYTLLGWPDRFVDLCERAGVTASRVTMDGQYRAIIPKWFEEAVNERLSRIAEHPNLVRVAR